uniref:Ig-like domain-containing protein n=1 Tax=Pontiella sp. TaxID=2837462 RepID=UPI003563342A
TWNVDVSDNLSILREDAVTFMTNVVAEMSITNRAPIFTMDPIVMSNATAYVAYAGTLGGSATDADNDPLTFAKVDGPAWLSVATNGTLSGTPTFFDEGLNRFTVQVSDDDGGTNSATLEIAVDHGVVPTTMVQFDNLRGNLSDGTINGLPISNPHVGITKTTNGNDVVYSLRIVNQDLDGGGTFTDSLSWDVRVKGYAGGSFVLNGNDSSVTLGSNVLVGTFDNEFGVSGSDSRFTGPGESLRFSVENLVLTADAGFAARFDGFSGLWGTTGSYIYGEGPGGLESQQTTNNGALTFATNAVLTVTPAVNSERIRDLDGSFTVSAIEPAVAAVSFSVIQDGGQDYPGMTYTRVIAPAAYRIETTTNLTTSSWVPRSVGAADADVTMVAGPVDNTDGTETLSFRLNQGLDANPQLFIRINGAE